MRFVLSLIGSLVLAAILGLGSAYVAVFQGLRGDARVQNGPWTTNLATGGADADMYTRAYVAITAIFALSNEETIYYIALTDSAGEKLSGACSYRIEGRDPDTRWWSITAYGNDHYLIDNPGKRYSVSKNSVTRAADGSFVVRLSTTEEAGNWIATSPDGFQLALRLYNPGKSVRDDPGGVHLPTVTKEACS